jgi:hypothetical protein
MRVAGLALDAVRDVEDQAGPFAFDHSRHELLKPVHEVFVAFECNDLMAALRERGLQPPNRLEADLLAIELTEQIDDAGALAVVDDGDLHETPLGRPAPAQVRAQPRSRVKNVTSVGK